MEQTQAFENRVLERLNAGKTVRSFLITAVELLTEAVNILVLQVFRKDDYAVKYAVEPLLDGDGPLGDLSVRLKLIYGLGVLSRPEYEDAELLMALRQQQVLHSGVPDREQPIFTEPDGHVPHPDSFTRHLRKLYKKCGLSEDYHLHTLRHFYATYLLQEGTSKQVAASLLGHADTAFLERTYCHPQDVAKQQAANLMQDLLNNQNPCYVAFMKNKNRKAKKAG